MQAYNYWQDQPDSRPSRVCCGEGTVGNATAAPSRPTRSASELDGRARTAADRRAEGHSSRVPRRVCLSACVLRVGRGVTARTSTTADPVVARTTTGGWTRRRERGAAALAAAPNLARTARTACPDAALSARTGVASRRAPRNPPLSVRAHSQWLALFGGRGGDLLPAPVPGWRTTTCRSTAAPPTPCVYFPIAAASPGKPGRARRTGQVDVRLALLA